MKKIEGSTHELWDSISWNNIQIMGVPEGEGRVKGTENLFKEVVSENFTNQGEIWPSRNMKATDPK